MTKALIASPSKSARFAGTDSIISRVSRPFGDGEFGELDLVLRVCG